MLYLNGKPVTPTIFPDGTSQVWKLNNEDLLGTPFADVRWEFQSEAEFMQLAQLKMLLDKSSTPTHLAMTYLPYGRQDKNIANDATFALLPFALLLNGLHFLSVTCLDPHSSVAKGLINGFQATYPKDELRKAMIATNSTLVCYPDRGARTKYAGVYNSVVGDEFIYGEKVRDQSTGFITSYHLETGRHLLKEHNVLIVDDICDGGATFQILAKSLQEAGCENVSLFVTHGIFSKGIRPLKDAGIKRIFTAQGEAFHDSRTIGHVVYETFKPETT